MVRFKAAAFISPDTQLLNLPTTTSKIQRFENEQSSSVLANLACDSFPPDRPKVIRFHSKMHIYYFLTLLLLYINHLNGICALVTLQTIRDLTAVTNGCHERITSSGNAEGGRVEIDLMVRVLGGQVVLSGDDDGKEIEDVRLVAAGDDQT